jgi:5'-deoxynucleotidase YfbR-like HD superfamily hydrolase
MDSGIAKIFDFIKAVNALKFEIRYGDDAPERRDRRDSVAAHSWRMCLLAYMLAERLNAEDGFGLDTARVIKIALIHDIPEAVCGDVSFDKMCDGRVSQEDKAAAEEKSMAGLCAILPEPEGGEIAAIYREYESLSSKEARFVKICDKLEAAFQSMFIGLGDGKNGLLPKPAITHSNKGYGWFPETDEIIRLVRAEFRKHCDEKGISWSPDYDLPQTSPCARPDGGRAKLS